MKNTNSVKKEHLGKRFGKQTVKIVDSTVNIAVLTLFLMFLVYGLYALWDTNQIYRAADSRGFSMYKPVNEEESLSFGELQEMNSEVFAWLTVYGTHVDYPVAQADNNDDYVNLNILREYSLSGSLFLDYRNTGEFTEFNSIIYGHHMDKNAMFGELTKFQEEQFFDEHRYGNLYYNGKHYGIELFAFMDVDAYDASVYDYHVTDDTVQKYVDNLYAKASVSRDIGVTTENRLVLLSTCTTDSTNGRHVVVARITDEVYENIFYMADAANRNTVRGVDMQGGLWMLVKSFPWWLWTLLALLLCILMYYVAGRKERKKNNGEEIIQVFHN